MVTYKQSLLEGPLEAEVESLCKFTGSWRGEILPVYFNQRAQYVACGCLGRTTPRLTRATVYPEAVVVLHMVSQSLPLHA